MDALNDISSHSDSKELLQELISGLIARNQRRGPDAHGVLRSSLSGLSMDTSTPIKDISEPFIEMHGFLLAMRGFLPQPLSSLDSDGHISSSLVWNGEVYRAPFMKDVSIADTASTSDQIEKNDTEEIAASFRSLPPMQALEPVEGEYAITYLDVKAGKVTFGRDPQGRRSLMAAKILDNYLVLSSVPLSILGLSIEWVEVDKKGLYSIDLNTGVIALEPWKPELSQMSLRHPSLSNSCEIVKSEDLVDELMEVLRASIRRRVAFRGSKVGAKVSNKESNSEDSEIVGESISVLFSGGLDSTVIAAIADLELPLDVEIELINVAFGTAEQASAAPDRVTCLESFVDLMNIAPKRKWRLNLVTIRRDELTEFTAPIASLMYPNNTLMDISISAPLWFASRGAGMTPEPGFTDLKTASFVPHLSRSKVLLLGAGADEQFAGYGRHRVSFKRGGWEGLQAELDKDLKRLHKRNLGRDDRVLADHGREARFPYLDEGVMKWIVGRKLPEICDFETFGPGHGDKRVLRLVAHKLGLKNAAILPKRAIQFGTKITKQMPKGKGTDNFEA